MMHIEVSEIVLQHDCNLMVETWNVKWDVVNDIPIKTLTTFYKHTIGFFDLIKKGMTNRDCITSTGKGFIKEMITRYNYDIDVINEVKLDEVKQDEVTNENPFYWFIEGVLLGRKELEDVRNCGA